VSCNVTMRPSASELHRLEQAAARCVPSLKRSALALHAFRLGLIMIEAAQESGSGLPKVDEAPARKKKGKP